MKKVLVVDDNADILNVIRIILESEDYHVSCVSTGEEVEEAVPAFRPDLILLDIMLGGMDGRDVCNLLKSNKATSSIPIIMISASHTIDRARETDYQAEDFISKPFELDDLLAKVARYIS